MPQKLALMSAEVGQGYRDAVVPKCLVQLFCSVLWAFCIGPLNLTTEGVWKKEWVRTKEKGRPPPPASSYSNQGQGQSVSHRLLVPSAARMPADKGGRGAHQRWCHRTCKLKKAKEYLWSRHGLGRRSPLHVAFGWHGSLMFSKHLLCARSLPQVLIISLQHIHSGMSTLWPRKVWQR